MKSRYLVTAVTLLCIIVYSAVSSPRKTAFPLAENFPSGALVYAETDDLPQLLRHWTESGLGEKYLASTNFQQLQERHLGLKFASRWQEFSAAAGFAFDIATVAGLANKRAAVAVYDIGKLDLVFLAPMSAEAYAATEFVRDSGNFAEEEYQGEKIFRVKVKADRGRQKQELIVSHLQSHLLIATSEKLFIRAAANLRRGSKTDRLSDQPAFSKLSTAIGSGTAAVWLDQAALNGDYYFKRYFLSADRKDLKDVRSVAATIEFAKGRIVEHRVFLSNDPDKLETAVLRPNAVVSYLPADSHFYKVQSADAADAATAIGEVIVGPAKERERTRAKKVSLNIFYSADSFLSYNERSYEASINEETDVADTPADRATAANLAAPLEAAAPVALARFASADTTANQIFPEFRRGVVVQLGSRSAFDTRQFESSVVETLTTITTVLHGTAEFDWATVRSCGVSARHLKMPLLGREIVYFLSGSNLLVADDQHRFCASLTARKTHKVSARPEPFTEMSFANLRSMREAYSDVFSRLAADDPSMDLFAGNIVGIVDVFGLSGIARRRWSGDGLEHEEITFYSE